MTQLVPMTPGNGASLVPIEAQQELIDLANEAWSKSTHRTYRVLLGQFVKWCRDRGAHPMPASPELVAFYLSTRAKQGRKLSTLQLTLCAISQAHKLAGQPNPRDDHSLARVMSGLTNRLGKAQNRKRAVTIEDLDKMLDAYHRGSVAHIRNKAILLVAFQSALRRSELCALKRHNVREHKDGLLLHLEHSKTDQAGEGYDVPLFRTGSERCPVHALSRWLKISARLEDDDPLFVSVTRHGKLRRTALLGNDIARIVKKAVAHFDPALVPYFSGHSTRAGFITAADSAGVSIQDIMAISRHTNYQTTLKYIRHTNPTRNRAGCKLGL